MNAETGDEQEREEDSKQNPGSRGWALAAGAVGLILSPFSWGGFAGVLPYMQEFPSDEPEYWIRFAVNVIFFQWVVFGAFLFCPKRSGGTLSEIGFPADWRELQVALIAVTTALLVVGAVLVASARPENAEVPAIVPETLGDPIVTILLLAPTAADSGRDDLPGLRPHVPSEALRCTYVDGGHHLVPPLLPDARGLERP